jgi:hypothetical protein
MAIIGPFKSQWGDYTVTQATLYTPIERSEINESIERQSYIYFETTDMNDVVQIVVNGLWRIDGGEIHRRSNWGTRKCVRKAEARKIWKQYVEKGYSANIEGMCDD